MSSQPPAKKPAPIVAIKHYVEARSQNLERIVQGTGINLQRFMTLAFNQTLQTPSLTTCTPASWFDALQKCATHGLLPDGIHGALVPYKDRVTFVPMYQGLVQRAYQTKLVTKLWADVVYEGEHFEVILGDEPRLRHVPSDDRGDPAKLVACYACAKVNGETHFAVLFSKDVARHRAASKTATRSDSPWQTHTAEMWKKTALISLSKTLPHFNSEAMKFSELASESERDEIIDVELKPEDEKPSQLEQAKEKLRASAPHEPPAEQTKPDLKSGEACFHPATWRLADKLPQGKTLVCPDCGKDNLTASDVLEAQNRAGQ